MKNGKKMYVVRGSEDGIIGVFSNIKRAYEKASHYAKTCAGSTTANPSYANVTKNFKDGYGIVTIENDGGYGTADIERFYLNQ